MKILDILGKTKKAIGGIIAIFLVALLIFYAGTRFASGNAQPKILYWFDPTASGN